MRTLATLLGLLSAAFAAVVLRPVNSYQSWLLKATATAQTPALMVLGSIAAALGVKRRAPVAMLTGVFGAVVGAWYIRQATAPHDGFERAFGPDWQERIPAEAERRMLRQRLTWRLPHVPAPRWTRDVVFATIPGTERQLLADLWQPAEGIALTGTVIVYLYGGSWHFFDKDVLTRPFFRQLAAQGHVVMDAGHRSCPETDLRGMVGDVHRAVAWIKEHAAEYGVDPARVVLMGGSSGAHIASLAAYAPDEPAFKPAELAGIDTSVMAVVPYYGIPEMRSSYERWKGQAGNDADQPQPEFERREPGKVANAINTLIMGRPLTASQSPPAPPYRQLFQNLLGGQPDQVPEMFDLASPVTHVSATCPPTLIFQGTHDVVVPLDEARRLSHALEDAGATVIYIEYPWADHAFDLMYPPLANPAAKAALYDLERFLACVPAPRTAAAM